MSPFNFIASYVCDIKTKLYTYIGRLDKFDKQERDILIYNRVKRVITKKAVRRAVLRLREIMSMPVFQGFRLVAGEGGIDREVGTVSVMDAPDIYKWMKGGEFLITSGYVVKDCPEYIRSLIINLDKGGAAALGVKFDRFIHEFPEDALKAADELNFPIVSIPYEFAFTDVIDPVLWEVVDRQSRRLLYSERIHEAFTRMVLKDEEIPAILAFLRQHIHRETAFIDTRFSKIYFAAGTEEASVIYEDWNGWDVDAGTAPGQSENYEFYRMHINEEEYGYIILGTQLDGFDEFFRDYYQIAIEQAGIILTLKIQKQMATVQIETEYREQFVQDILTGNIRSKEEIINRARIYNWNFYFGGIAVIVDIDRFKDQYLQELDMERNRRLDGMIRRILNISRRIADREFQNYVYSRMSDQIVFVISETYNKRSRFMERIKLVFGEVKEEIHRSVAFTATIGVGNYKKDIAHIKESYEEARRSVVISRNMLREDVVSVYDELGAYKLLSLVSMSEEAKEFQRLYVQRIREYDIKHHTEMLKTALVLAACGWNLKEASERLYIHYNSMKYRYRKICQILEMNLQDQEQRLNLELALKLYQIHAYR